jgi:hypothetical protein
VITFAEGVAIKQALAVASCSSRIPCAGNPGVYFTFTFQRGPLSLKVVPLEIEQPAITFVISPDMK